MNDIHTVYAENSRVHEAERRLDQADRIVTEFEKEVVKAARHLVYTLYDQDNASKNLTRAVYDLDNERDHQRACQEMLEGEILEAIQAGA